MPVRTQPTAPPAPAQLTALTDAAWRDEVVPLLPPDLAAQAQALGAFQRVRGLATPTDRLRALRTCAIDGLATRGLGAWAVLTGVADLSATAWRTRLRQSRAWLGWLRRPLLSGAVAAPLALARRGRRIRLIDATRLAQVGGTGDDGRAHLSDDLLAGRMDEVVVSDRHTAEGLTHCRFQAGDIAVSDSG